MPASGNIVELRRVLAERFPHASLTLERRKSGASRATGVPTLDELLGGGLPQGELTELVGAGEGSGSAQVLHAVLQRTASDGQFLALVDGADSFDVDTVEPDILARLLWVRCAQTEEALKAADLLLRDRNFPVVVLDLKLNPLAELRKISSSVWFRFRRLLEQNQTTFLVVTPHPLVGSAACRVQVESRLSLGALEQSPSVVLSQLQFALLRSAEKTATTATAQTG